MQKLLERILPELSIERIEYPELQKTIRPDVDAKSVRLDVYVRDDKQTVYDIEIQAVNTGELPKRSRYYSSMLDLQMIDAGQTYKKLNQSYVIFICLEDIFGKGFYKYSFENICLEEKEIRLNDGTRKIFLNASGSVGTVSKELKAFLDYVSGKISDDTYVKELDEAVKRAKTNREWRREYMTLLMRDQENLEKGREEGRIEGRKEGRIEGQREGKKVIIVKMLKKGVNESDIAMYTDATPEEIEKIRKELME